MIGLVWFVVWRLWLAGFLVCFALDWMHAYSGARLGREAHIASALEHGIPARRVEAFVDARGRMSALFVIVTLVRPVGFLCAAGAMLLALIVALARLALAALRKWVAVVRWLLVLGLAWLLLRGAYVGVLLPLVRWRGLRFYLGRRWRIR